MPRELQGPRDLLAQLFRDRADCLVRLIDEHLTRDVPWDLQGGENLWKDGIDLSVYRSGLRPVGCPKITPRAVCRSIAQKKVPVGMSYDHSARSLKYRICHLSNGFQSQGEESAYSLEMISRGDSAALARYKGVLKILHQNGYRHIIGTTQNACRMENCLADVMAQESKSYVYGRPACSIFSAGLRWWWPAAAQRARHLSSKGSWSDC